MHNGSHDQRGQRGRERGEGEGGEKRERRRKKGGRKKKRKKEGCRVTVIVAVGREGGEKKKKGKRTGEGKERGQFFFSKSLNKTKVFLQFL